MSCFSKCFESYLYVLGGRGLRQGRAQPTSGSYSVPAGLGSRGCDPWSLMGLCPKRGPALTSMLCDPSNASSFSNQGVLHFHVTLGPAHGCVSPVAPRHRSPRHFHTVFLWILPITRGVIILALLMCTRRLREVKLFAQNHTAGMWWNWDPNPDYTVPQTHSPSPDRLTGHLVLKHLFLPLFQLQFSNSP